TDVCTLKRRRVIDAVAGQATTSLLACNACTSRSLCSGQCGQYDVEGIGYAPEGRVSRDGQESDRRTWRPGSARPCRRQPPGQGGQEQADAGRTVLTRSRRLAAFILTFLKEVA